MPQSWTSGEPHRLVPMALPGCTTPGPHTSHFERHLLCSACTHFSVGVPKLSIEMHSPHSTTPSPHHPTTPPRHHATHATTPPRHHATTPPRHHATTPPRHHATTPPRHHATTPPRHHATTATTPPPPPPHHRHHATTPPRHHATTPPRHHATTLHALFGGEAGVRAPLSTRRGERKSA